MEPVDLPPLRFPLREALLSLQQSAQGPPSVRTALAESASLGSLGPYKVSSTEKSRALKKIGRLKRRGEHLGRGYAEERPLSTPRPAERPKTVPKSVPSAVSRNKLEMVRFAQDAASITWPMEKSISAPNLNSPAHEVSLGDIPQTWTSAARAVLGHGRRHATQPSNEEPPPAGLSRDSSWCGASLATLPGLPKVVKDWAITGLEFTDGGLGIGSRDNPEVTNLVKRSPGFNYDVKSGNVGLWNPHASLPTKQPLSQHFSAASARMGARRDVQKRYERRPGPGYYDVPGFTDELLRKIAKRPGYSPWTEQLKSAKHSK
ncbi:unnamed protein product [Effrenium voratum]|uniref:Uncharacterized protein n=1 Tax=Effrenium voratum TaxID=2562239 RepID=A0AA36IJ74_9DINO|nr:unnamed protein product [Effrenium voratum]CAJ1431635.1 unnamed protein product [Effrenium voratum]